MTNGPQTALERELQANGQETNHNGVGLAPADASPRPTGPRIRPSQSAYRPTPNSNPQPLFNSAANQPTDRGGSRPRRTGWDLPALIRPLPIRQQPRPRLA